MLMVVEDNIDDRELVLTALSRHCPREAVAVAPDGVHALEYLGAGVSGKSVSAARIPELILVDIKMPRMDGLEFLRQVKSDERFGAVPVVVFTSSREARDIDGAYRAGTNAYVVKPVIFSEFSAVVDAIAGFWLRVNVAPVIPAARTGSGRSG